MVANPVQSATGLLDRPDGSTTGWTLSSDGAWTSETSPTLISFDQSPIPAQVPSLAGSDAGGDREGFCLVDTDGSWYMFYGAGDGSQGAGGPWRPQVSKSTNRGLTWTKLGPLSMGLSNGAGGAAWAATDLLFVELRGGFYYLHRLTAGSVAYNQIDGEPYTSDVWKASTITGTYSYVGVTVSQGASGAFDATDAYASCMVLDNSGTYHLFYSATSGQGSGYQVGRSTASSPSGPFTKSGSAVLPAAIAGSPENPEVFYHAGLGKWVMITNQVTTSAGATLGSRVFFSTSLTDWSAATYHDYQRICPMDGVNAIGLSRVPRASTNAPLIDTTSGLGTVPILYDGYPKAASGSNLNHIGRRISWAAMEAALQGMTYTPPSGGGGGGATFTDNFSTETAGALGGQNGWTDVSGSNAKPQVVAGSPNYLDMQSSVGPSMVVQKGLGNNYQAGDASGTYTMVSNFDAQCGTGMVFGWIVDDGSFFHVDVSNNSATIVFTNGSGGENNLASASPTCSTDTDHTIKVTASTAGVITVLVDGSQLFNYQLSGPYLTRFQNGGHPGLRNGYGSTGRRWIKSFSYAPGGASATATPSVASRSVSHADFVTEFAVCFPALGGVCDLFYRLQSATSQANGYRVRLDGGGSNAIGAAAAVVSAGVDYPFTNMDTTTFGTSVKALAGVWHRVRIIVTGSRHQVFVDGQKQLDFTDSTFLSGVAWARSASGGSIRFRTAHMRSGQGVTVEGLAVGDVVTLRGPGGIPIASRTAIADQIHLSADHFPQTSIDLNGVDVITPAGGIWGGDTYNMQEYPTAASVAATDNVLVQQGGVTKFATIAQVRAAS